MTKKVMQLRNLFVFILAAEVFVTFSLYLILTTKTLFVLAVYITIRNIIAFGFVIYGSSILEKNSLSVAEALDVDAKNALIFGGVGLIQYDENRNITWISDLLKAMNINIVGVKLLEWQPTLASLFENDDIKVIDVKGKKFEVYNSMETRLMYLKDMTQYLSLEQDYEDQQMCLGYVTIDNYEETLENADEPKMALIQSKCRQILIDWAYSNGMIIRRFKSGGYLVFFNERIYKKQVENKFAILDAFKRECVELDEVMTLSIGIGRGTRVLRELEELASQALSLTYSRGGDQVAIKSGKDNVRFFGGTTDSFEKSSKVRARVIAQSLTGLIKRSRNVLIMGHKNSDLDSFGASIGMARIVEAYDKKVNIVLDYDSLEEKTAAVAADLRDDYRYNGLIINAVDALERVYRDTLLIVVDNHKPSLAISIALLDKTRNKVIIDHHRRGEEFIETPVLTYLEPSASSTVELIVELFDYQSADLRINDLDATIMYSGMLVDTNYFRQRVGVRTFQSAADLKDMQADVSRAYEFLEDSFDRTVEVMNITKSAYQFYDDILIACGKEEDEHTKTTLAKASNKLLEVSNIKAAFTVGRVSKTSVAISARSSKDINVQMIMEALGGGGHFSMAACQIDNETIEGATKRLEEAIDTYFENRGD